MKERYSIEQPFRKMSLIDACLKVLRDHSDKEVHEQWLARTRLST